MTLFLLLAAVVLVAALVVRQPTLVGLSPLMPTDPAARQRLNVTRLLALGFAAAFVACLITAPDHFTALIGGGGILGVGGMIVDAQCLLSDAQALTVTAVSTNAYDTGAAGNALDVGAPMCVVFTVDVAAKTSNSDETYQINLIQSANADLSSADVLLTTNTTFMARGFFTASKKFFLPIPPGAKTKRYIGVSYTLGGTSPTMTITSFLQPMNMLQNDVINASGWTVNN